MGAIISREQWGARPPKNVSRTVDLSPELVVHHSTGPVPSPTLAAETLYTRSIQNFHMDTRGWSDYAYGYGVGPSGRIYVGRGINVWGAHCPGKNDILSVCLYGDYTVRDVPAAMREAVWQIADMHGKSKLIGHRQAYSTSCPGDEGMRDVVNAGRPFTQPVDTSPLPDGGTLRLVLNDRGWAGWPATTGPLKWIAKNGVAPDAKVALAWRGSVHREPETVNLVAATLVNRFLS